MLSRLLVALGLAAALVAGALLAFLRTDFAANNLCAYAVATIEEATQAQVRVASCSVEPARGELAIDGLQVGDPGGRVDLKVARVFVKVMVRPVLQRLRLERLEIDRPELHLALDETGGGVQGTPGQCLPEVLERFELGRVKIRKASVEVRASGVRVAVPRVSVAVKPRAGLLHVSVATRGGSVELPGRTVGLISVRASAGVDLRGAGAVDLKKADVIGSELSAFVSGKLTDLCDPHVEANVNVRVDDLATATARLAPGAFTDLKGGLSVDGTVVFNRGRPRMRGDLRLKSVAIGGYVPGDARFRFDASRARLRIEQIEVPVLRGVVAGSAEVDLADPAVPISADLTLRDVELAEVLRRVGMPQSLAVLRASGKVAVRGRVAPFQLGGDVAVDVADFAVLDRPWQKRVRGPAMFEIRKARLTTALGIDRDKVELKRVALDLGSATSHVDAEATFYTDVRRGMEIAGRSEGLDLADAGGHFGPLPARGRAAFTARVYGPYADVRVEGPASVRDFRFMDLSLGDVSAQVGFSTRSMQLALEEVRGRKGATAYTGRIALALGEHDTPMAAHVEIVEGTVHDLVALAVGLVPSLSPLQDAEDADGGISGVIDARGPASGPDGTASLELSDPSLFGQKFLGGEARLTLHGAEPRLQIDRLMLFRGDGTLSVGGRFGPDWQLDMEARTEGFSLSDIDAGEPAHLAGPLDLEARIGGTAQHPKIAATAKFTDANAGRAVLGDGDVSLQLDGTALAWRAKVGTHSIEGQATLLSRSEAPGAPYDFPYTCTASLRIPDLAAYLETLAPELEVQAGSASADVEVRGSLLDLRSSEGTVRLSALKLVRGEMPFENEGPAQLSFGRSGVHIDKLALRAPYTTAQLSGSRGADGKLDIRLAASVDGRLLQGVVPDIEHASGTWLVQAAVGGTTQAPTVLGNFRIEDAEVRLRGLPVSARQLNGSISFSQDALVIDSLQGKLNNGEARVSGGMEMTRLHPKRIDMSAHVSDVNVRLQDTLGMTVDGDLTLYGPPLEPTLGGSLVVSRMKYTEDLDVERSLLDFSRRPPSPRVLTKSPVLVHFDLDVHLSRGVRIENNLARADLKGDLKVTGTSRAVGLVGSLNTVHGTAAFRGNEFQIEQGVLTFTDRQRIRPTFDVHATSQVKEYKVRLHAFGTPGEPHLSLTSDPALAEADLGFLLTFGFVSQNLQQGNLVAADSGLAIGVEALNKVTGFSEEVRRFIPKNAILRDPNIDFASDFSVTTNRLEPMARFRSHLLNERLDLRVLEGLTTRRYRGVVSYQLSDVLSTRLQLDNEHVQTGTDFGLDLHLKWEGE